MPGKSARPNSAKDNPTKWGQLHQEAVEKGQRHYIDPDNGYLVFTELEHKDRGYCCESGCRHCPYSDD